MNGPGPGAGRAAQGAGARPGPVAGWPGPLLALLLAALALLLLLPAAARAGTVSLDELPAGPLGAWATVLVESPDTPLDLAGAQAAYAAGRFEPSAAAVPSRGLGAAPMWLRLAVDNAAPQAERLRLVAGVSWLDRLDIYLVQDGRLLGRWLTGDERPGARGLQPAVGYGFELAFPPGASELWLRVQSVDPSVVPVELLPPAEAAAQAQRVQFLQGALNGFVLALVTSYVLLYVVLRERSHLRYVLYLLGFLVLNLCHTGYGLLWLWPQHPELQRYAILASMVGFCTLGLAFARGFLRLAQHAPRADAVVLAAMAGGPLALACCIVAGSQLGALRVAFGFTSAFAVGLVALGVVALRAGVAAGRTFLFAALFSAVGAFVTTLAVLGWLPFTPATYHAVSLGVVAEASIWALMLALRLRQQQRDSVQARALAHRDPLTGLNNRRGFLEQAQRWWGVAGGPLRRVSVVMIDVDHFKAINDRLGHPVGDAVLVHLAALLASSCRAGDVLARWGGEEFVLLLPDTGLPQTHALAERMRRRIAAEPVPVGAHTVALTASFGVAECEPGMGLDALIAAVDEQLYDAKQGGRNRVSPAVSPLAVSSMGGSAW